MAFVTVTIRQGGEVVETVFLDINVGDPVLNSDFWGECNREIEYVPEPSGSIVEWLKMNEPKSRVEIEPVIGQLLLSIDNSLMRLSTTV